MVAFPDERNILIYEVPITESQSNQAAFCSGVALARKHDDSVHVVFFIDQPRVCGNTERIANLRVVMSANSWAQAVDVISRAIGVKPKEAVGVDGER